MKELIAKLETLKESKERKDAVQKLRDAQEEKNKIILEGTIDLSYEDAYYSEADMIRHEIKFISDLI